MKLPPLPPIRTVEVKLQDEVFAAIDGFDVTLQGADA